MSYILTVMHELRQQIQTYRESILEIPATDEIHMEDQNHGLDWTKPSNGMYSTQHSQQTYRITSESCGTRTIKEE